MSKRTELHDKLCEILGSKNVYFQAPSSLKMQYDAIRYTLGGKDIKKADNKIYISRNRYDGVLIVKDQETDVIDKLLNGFDMCSLGTSYISDNLYHYPFTIYY